MTWAGSTAALAVDLTIAAGTSAGVVDLAVGDSLWVSAQGFAVGAAVDIRLRDPLGTVVETKRGRADERGVLGPQLVWRRTGVSGCDEVVAIASRGAVVTDAVPQYRTFEMAEADLIGEQWNVEVTDPSGRLLASPRRLNLIRTQQLQVYWSDAQGCPRRSFGLGEPMLIGFRGAVIPPWARVWVIVDRPQWNDEVPLVDVRPGVGSGGTLHALLGASPVVVQVSDGTLDEGYFAGIVRIDWQGGIPSSDPSLRSTDGVLSDRSPNGGRGATEEGVVIIDWGG